eukprot:Skav221969  [mRNA]  locus=scaffold195:889001:891447:- [translate_table: standard]
MWVYLQFPDVKEYGGKPRLSSMYALESEEHDPWPRNQRWGFVLQELPKDDYVYQEDVEKPMRQRLARKPRGTGWQRVGDKADGVFHTSLITACRRGAAWAAAAELLESLEEGGGGAAWVSWLVV